MENLARRDDKVEDANEKVHLSFSKSIAMLFPLMYTFHFSILNACPRTRSVRLLTPPSPKKIQAISGLKRELS